MSKSCTKNNVHTCIEQKYNCEVVVIPVDFSDGMEIYPNIAERLQDLDIGILSKPYIHMYHRSGNFRR